MKNVTLVFAFSILFALSASAQVNIDKIKMGTGSGHGITLESGGSGHFTILQGTNGVDTLTFPAGGGTIQSSGGPIVVSTEVDTAKAADTVMLSGSTACATVVSNGSTTDVTASIASATSGQVLYLFNNLGTTHNVTFKGVTIGQGTFGIFMYLAGDWRVLAVPAVI